MRINDLTWEDLLKTTVQQAILNDIEDWASEDWDLTFADINGSDGASLEYQSDHYCILYEIPDEGDDVIVSVLNKYSGEPLFQYVSKADEDTFKRNSVYEVLTYNSNDSLELFIAKLMKNIEHPEFMNESIRRRRAIKKRVGIKK